MAAPSFVDAQTGAVDTAGAWTYTCQASAAAGNVFIVHILSDGTTNAGNIVTSGTNIENLAGTDNAWTAIVSGGSDVSFRQVGSPLAANQYIFIGRALSTAAPTVSGTGSGDDVYVRSYQFQDVSIGTTLPTVIENSGASGGPDLFANGVGTSNTASDTAVTTLGPDRLALNFVAVNDDNAISAFTGETGGDWTLAVSPYAESSGTDGAIALQAAYLQETSATGGFDRKIGDSSGRIYVAGSFIAAAARTAYSVEILLGANTGSPTDDLTLEIWSDSSGTPGTAISGSATRTSAQLTASAWNSFVLSSPATLSASTRYWIVVHTSGAGDASNCRNWQYAAGTEAFKFDDSTPSTWGTGTTGVIATYRVLGPGTIDGGTGSIVDSDAWGVVGFALIGTTVAGPTYQPRDAETFHDFR